MREMMFVVAVALWIIYLVLLLLSGKECPPNLPKGPMAVFYRMGFYLYKKIGLRGVCFAGQKRVKQDLARLHPGENSELVCTDYYVRKLALSLLIALAGTVLGVIISGKAQSSRLLQEGVVRGSFEEGAKEIVLEASFEDGSENYFTVQVGSRQLSEQELEGYFQSFSESLPVLILGKNASMQEVCEALELRDEYIGYPFVLKWSSSRPEIVSDTGSVAEVEEKTELALTAYVIYGDNDEWERQVELPICVMPPLLSSVEKKQREMETFLDREEQISRQDAVWKLPESFQGQAVKWHRVAEDYSVPVWAVAVLLAVVTFFLADKDVHDDLEKRKKEMKRQYPDVLQKLTLYMGAGLTVRAAFLKIADNYEREKKQGKKKIFVYEEVVYACRELRSGVSEGSVYEHWGKRIGVQEYTRLSTLLIQNLKKGNRTLLQRLKEEADKACTEQLQNSKKLGEEASTKLLLPMMLMLVVIMVLIMIPAFSNIGL